MACLRVSVLWTDSLDHPAPQPTAKWKEQAQLPFLGYTPTKQITFPSQVFLISTLLWIKMNYPLPVIFYSVFYISPMHRGSREQHVWFPLDETAKVIYCVLCHNGFIYRYKSRAQMEGKRLSYKGSKSILSRQILRQIETERVRERSCMLINITQFRAFCSLLTQTTDCFSLSQRRTSSSSSVSRKGDQVPSVSGHKAQQLHSCEAKLPDYLTNQKYCSRCADITWKWRLLIGDAGGWCSSIWANSMKMSQKIA